MVDIYYFGHNCFRVKGKKSSILIDPYDASIGLKVPKDLSSDIVLVSKDEPEFNNVKLGGVSPVIVQGPGEYEIKEVTILGRKYKGNTIYKFTIECVNFLHLDSLNEKFDISKMPDLNDIDVLMFPVDAPLVLITEIEPTIVLPMHYKTERHTAKFSALKTIEEFRKKAGLDATKISGKLAVQKEKLPEQTTLYIFE